MPYQTPTLRFIYLLTVAFSVFACNKPTVTQPAPIHYDDIFQISFTVDNAPVTKKYPQDSINIIDGYTRGQTDGSTLFGGGPTYALDGGKIIGIQLGSASGHITTNWDSAFASFVKLCSVGNKTYDIIRFAEQTQTNRVEIIYKDEKGDLWCTTKVDTVGSTMLKPAASPIQQNGSTFSITEEKQISFDNTKKNGVIIKGTFSCILYKFYTFEQKQVSGGSFVGVFGVI